MAMAIINFTDCANLQERRKRILFIEKERIIQVYLLVFKWKIQRDAGLGFFSILQIAKESDQCVQCNNETHSKVKHRRAADKMRGIFHVILQGHNYTNAFQGKNNRAEEEGPMGWINYAFTLCRCWQIREHVDKRNNNADKHQNVGNHREGCQELQIANQAHEDQRCTYNNNPKANTDLIFRILINHLLHIGCHKHQIDAAAAIFFM